jgi:hypothetical protein
LLTLLAAPWASAARDADTCVDNGPVGWFGSIDMGSWTTLLPYLWLLVPLAWTFPQEESPHEDDL